MRNILGRLGTPYDEVDAKPLVLDCKNDTPVLRVALRFTAEFILDGSGSIAAYRKKLFGMCRVEDSKFVQCPVITWLE